ncbi:MAG: ABC transporter [Bacteroidetes bacterium]|nr:MAG: ABC transporter [Bacteroidota bacterium]
MSEVILRALMQLFALIVDVDEVQQISEKERSIIRNFLSRLISNELIEKYMESFEHYLRLYHQDNLAKGSIKRRKRTSLTAVRILGICEKINLELEQRQKVYVIIQLVEYIAYGIEIRDTELDFLETVAASFNIPDEEFRDILNFIAFSLSEVPRKDHVLIVNNEKEAGPEGIHHIRKEKLDGRLSFLHIPSVNAHIMRYNGKGDLYLNGQHLHPGMAYAFEHGASLRGSVISPIYYTDVAGVFSTAAIAKKINFRARDVVFRFKNSKNGIQEFNLEEESGRLIGIMGGSGVGKSTLLNVLNGKLKPASGEILINGHNIYNKEERKAIQGVIGFIPQDDLLMDDLTVYQNLWFNARLCMGGSSEEEMEARVTEVLKSLGLWDIRDLKVGDPLSKVISGGQRKRVNIGLELIREPSVLFVDEPTSGLSSVDSEVVMNLLREQVYKGKLVIVNIHQPSSNLYKMFDRIVFLDTGGYQIYSGNPSEAVVYFKTRSNHANATEDQCPRCGNVDPDQVLQIIEAKMVNERGRLSRNRRVNAKEWFELFKKYGNPQHPSASMKPSPLPENHFRIPRRWAQMKIYLLRDFLTKISNTQYVLISMLEAPLLAVILGIFTKYFSGTRDDPGAYVFRNNENLPSYLLMSVVVFLFIGLTISSEEIIKDRKLLQRESFLNLSRFSYLNAKILIMFAISAIQTISYVLIGNQIFEIQGMTYNYWCILFATACFANILGLNISSAFNSVITVYIMIPFLLIPQILFSGVLVKFDKLHKSMTHDEYVPLIGEMLTSRWAFEALAVDQYKRNPYERNFFDIDQEISNLRYLSSFYIPTLKEKINACESSLSKQKREKVAALFGYFSELGIEPDDSTAAGMHASLDRLNEDLRKQTQALNIKRTEVQEALVKELGGLKAFSALRDDNDNKQLSNMLLNRNVLEKTVERGDKLVRQFEPIYMIPRSRYGRAHFYAPEKHLGKLRIDTRLFNLSVIWLSTFLLYLALYFDILRKAIAFTAQAMGKGAMLARRINQNNGRR